MSLRRRLTLLVIAAFVAALATMAIVVPRLVRDSLTDRLDDDLLGSGQFAAAALLRQQLGGADLSGGPPPDGRASVDDAYVQLRSSDGTVIEEDFVNAELGERASPNLPDTLPTDAGEPFDVGSVDGSEPDHWRVVALPSRPINGTEIQVVVAMPTTEIDATIARVERILLGTSVAVVVALGALTLLLIRIGLRPLRRMEQSAAAISSAGDLGRRVDHPAQSTELGQLGDTINRMLGRLESSFSDQQATEAKLRRFAADASHELRTPLTSIRGYAELHRRGAHDPAQVARSMERIERESERMDRLVEDLLLLARFDEGIPLQREPVDLSALVLDVVDDARAVQPHRTIVGTADPVDVIGDADRLTQAISNLLANTRVHTPETTPVEVIVASDGTIATVSVVDHGDGLLDDAFAKVFDRFHRVDESRSSSRGGSGLGLAITRSIIEAHNGDVTAEPTPGGGATFIVRLPLAPAPDLDTG